MATDWLSQGCEECRAGVLSARWRPPYIVSESLGLHTRLHRCTRCQSWWEENEREAHVIFDTELKKSWGKPLEPMHKALAPVVTYVRAGKPLVCQLQVNPYSCEFWEEARLERNNLEYEFPRYAPGFHGFATSGGGELFALSPTGSVICLPAVGMEPTAATLVASGWGHFLPLLRSAA